MADYKISALPAVVTIAGTEQMEVNQSGTSKRATITQVTSVEAATRAASDLTLALAITAETTARTNADATLQADIDTRLKSNGSVTATANQPMGGFKFTGLGAGTTAGNSVRYEQVALIDGTNAFTANQSFGGFRITNIALPGAGTDATSKNYVLSLEPANLTLPTTNFNVNTHKVINVSDPSSSQDAVTLAYLKAQEAWNLSANATGLTINASHSLTPGSDKNVNVLTGSSVTANRQISFIAAPTFDETFELIVPEFSVSAGNNHEITGARYYNGGFHNNERVVTVAAGLSSYFHPIYIDVIASGGIPDMHTRWISVLYDFAINGGAVSTITLDKVIPDGAILSNQAAIIETITAFTSGGAATVAWGYTGTVAGISAALAFGALPYTTIGAFLNASVAAVPVRLATGKAVTLTVAGAALTGGSAYIHIPILLNR